MFDAELARIGGSNVKESDSVVEGKEFTTPCFSPIGYLGLSIGYDVRFPELYRNMVLNGAQVMIVPSAFLAKTGATHWETLLRARAIENQVYMIASAQIGNVDKEIAGFGHSMVVDPWGDIIG